MKSSKPSITIIGTGALGSALQHFFEDHDYLIRSTWNSKGGSIFSKNSERSSENTTPETDDEVGDLVFITTPDDLIGEISHRLSKQSVLWQNKTVVHCSGNLTSTELKSLTEAGAKTVSMHPIQPFKKGDGSDRFRNISISLQGDEEAKKLLLPMIEEMGAKPLQLTKKQKRYLHIAAVMASNYLVALMFSVENLLKDVDAEDGFDALETLVHQTVTNIFEKGPADALTGPVARGDTESVQTHLQELQGREQEELYKILGLEAVKIAQQTGSVSDDKIGSLREIFQKKIH